MLMPAEMKSGSVLLPGSAGMKHHLRNSHTADLRAPSHGIQITPGRVDNRSFQAQYSLSSGRYT